MGHKQNLAKTFYSYLPIGSKAKNSGKIIKVIFAFSRNYLCLLIRKLTSNLLNVIFK